MWRTRRRRSLLVALLPKLYKHKNNLASYASSRDFQSAELSFLHANVSVNDFYFQVKSHEHFFFKLQLHTHHSLDFIGELKMLKITGYIHLHYKIPFYVAMLALVSFFFFFFFNNSQRVLFQYVQGLI